MRPEARSLRAAPFPNCSRRSALIFSAMSYPFRGPVKAPARCRRDRTRWAKRLAPTSITDASRIPRRSPTDECSGPGMYALDGTGAGSAQLAERLDLVRLTADEDGVVRQEHRVRGRVLPGGAAPLVGVDRDAELLAGLDLTERHADDRLARG